jgi:HEAT repeat protein
MTEPLVISTEAVYHLVVHVLWVVTSVFVGLLALIVVNKAWRESRESFTSRRRLEMEPGLFRYVMGTEPVETFIPSGGSRRDWPVIEQVFYDLLRVARGNVATRARDAFERLGMVDHYLGQLGSRRWWLRAEAAEKLGLMGSEKATPRLIVTMSDPMPEVRVRAAQALGGIGTPESLRPLVIALRDAGRWSAIRVAGMLISAGDDAVEVLLKEFDGLPNHAKISAIDIFGRIKSLRASKLLRDLLTDPSPDLRARAAYALGSIGDPTAAPQLSTCLTDREWSVRAMAAKALGRLRENGSIPALAAALSDPQWWVRANAAESLKSKGAAGQDALLGLLDSDDPYAAQQSVQMLQESGVLDAFVGMLISTSPGEQSRALGIMAKLVKLKRIDLLSETARDHPDRIVRQRLAAILGLSAPVT